MGYTHYWRSDGADIKDWRRAVDRINPILDQAEAEDIIYEVSVCDLAIEFSGQCEPFIFRRSSTDFDFCKTRGRAYDKVVIACLCILTDEIPTFSWSSDGDAEDHVEGAHLAGFAKSNARTNL